MKAPSFNAGVRFYVGKRRLSLGQPKLVLAAVLRPANFAEVQDGSGSWFSQLYVVRC